MAAFFKFPLRYVPNRITRKDRKKQVRMLLKSKQLYKKHAYYTRKPIKSYKYKKSKHVSNAQKAYKVNKIIINQELAKKTGCKISTLRRIMKKGQGAYFSSGSRPNQTAHSWGVARLASALTSGKAAAVDFKIIEKGCDHKKKAYRAALKAKRMYGYGNSATKKKKVRM